MDTVRARVGALTPAGLRCRRLPGRPGCQRARRQPACVRAGGEAHLHPAVRPLAPSLGAPPAATCQSAALPQPLLPPGGACDTGCWCRLPIGAQPTQAANTTLVNAVSGLTSSFSGSISNIQARPCAWVPASPDAARAGLPAASPQNAGQAAQASSAEQRLRLHVFAQNRLRRVATACTSEAAHGALIPGLPAQAAGTASCTTQICGTSNTYLASVSFSYAASTSFNSTAASAQRAYSSGAFQVPPMPCLRSQAKRSSSGSSSSGMQLYMGLRCACPTCSRVLSLPAQHGRQGLTLPVPRRTT